ncbi:MAG: hypothetical protein C0434_05710 [Xanthomonadaceae bacterium]|nr:hypothetical protein [Xanthomonadaceae bacterium]
MSKPGSTDPQSPQSAARATRLNGADDRATDPTRGLSLREFSNFPDLAAWCRPRVPEADRQRFAMGHGDAFVALLGFMRAYPGADLTLLAFSEPTADGRSDQLRMVFACVRSAGAPLLQVPASALLLYERGR